MIAPGKSVLVALAALSTSAALVAPAGALSAGSAQQPRSHHTVSGTKLCKAFGKGLKCKPGYAPAAGVETHYDAVESVSVLEKSTVLMRTEHTSCSTVTVSFFVDDDEDVSRLVLKTVTGKFPVETSGTNVGTVTARVGRNPFKVVASVPSPGFGVDFDTDFYLAAQADCHSKTGK